MQRITNWLSRRNTETFRTPKSIYLSSFFIRKQRIRYQHLTHQRYFPAVIKQVLHKKKFAKTKKLAQISGIVLLSIPAESINITPMYQVSTIAYDNVMASHTLTIASVPGPSTFFSTDSFQHGFGYDLATAYAYRLGVSVDIISFASEEEALKAVQTGAADMALTTASTLQNEEAGLSAINISCGFDSQLVANGLHPKTSWSFRTSKDPLAVSASDFLCANDQLLNTAKIANFYDQNLMKDDYNRSHFEKIMDKNLPTYKASFQEQADTHNLDWQLLVAMGYQESHLNANAVSPTGVKGLMMLTNNTAKAMGVSDRVDPHQSISGGARYLDEMQELFIDVPNPDRLWFSLASYNMGPNAVKNIQDKVEASGKNPNRWSNIYAYMSDNSARNSRYVQCMHYVTNIRSYLESLKSGTSTV